MLQVDCQREDRFPYEPSREEKSAFEYVFFADEYPRGFNVSTIPWLISRSLFVFMLLINVSAIMYSFINAPMRGGGNLQSGEICGLKNRADNVLITVSAGLEAALLMGQLVPAAYFLWQLMVCVDATCYDDPEEHSAAYTIFAARHVAQHADAHVSIPAAVQEFCTLYEAGICVWMHTLSG